MQCWGCTRFLGGHHGLFVAEHHHHCGSGRAGWSDCEGLPGMSRDESMRNHPSFGGAIAALWDIAADEMQRASDDE